MGLERMEYRFDVISDFNGNSYILSEIQRRLELARFEVQKGEAIDIFSKAYSADNAKIKIKEERTKITRWQVRRRDYWLSDRYNYWSDEALAAIGLTREERPLEKIKLEKAEYNFEVVSSYAGNDFILDKIARWLVHAVNDVATGSAKELGTPIIGDNQTIDAKETHIENWNVRRYYPDIEEEEGDKEESKQEGDDGE